MPLKQQPTDGLRLSPKAAARESFVGSRRGRRLVGLDGRRLVAEQPGRDHGLANPGWNVLQSIPAQQSNTAQFLELLGLSEIDPRYSARGG
jgi:hypothetical protein